MGSPFCVDVFCAKVIVMFFAVIQCIMDITCVEVKDIVCQYIMIELTLVVV